MRRTMHHALMEMDKEITVDCDKCKCKQLKDLKSK